MNATWIRPDVRRTFAQHEADLRSREASGPLAAIVTSAGKPGAVTGAGPGSGKASAFRRLADWPRKWFGRAAAEQPTKEVGHASIEVSRGFKVEPVELLGGLKGRDFVLEDAVGRERFSARLLDGEQTLNVNWADNLPRTFARLRETRQLAGGPGAFTRITGTASDKLEADVRTGRFDADHVAVMLGRSLGGRWRVQVVPRPGQVGAFDIVADLIGGE